MVRRVHIPNINILALNVSIDIAVFDIYSNHECTRKELKTIGLYNVTEGLHTSQ